MTLQEKLEYEFQCFFLDLMRTSKENIFAHSREIETKKKLMEALYQMTETLEKEKKNFLMPQHNLLESIYCYWKNAGQKNSMDDMEKMIKAWLDFLMQKQKFSRP